MENWGCWILDGWGVNAGSGLLRTIPPRGFAQYVDWTGDLTRRAALAGTEQGLRSACTSVGLSNSWRTARTKGVRTTSTCRFVVPDYLSPGIGFAQKFVVGGVSDPDTLRRTTTSCDARRNRRRRRLPQVVLGKASGSLSACTVAEDRP